MSSKEQVMNELSRLIERVNDGLDFAADNAPLIAEQFIYKSILYHSVLLAIGIVLFIPISWFCIRLLIQCIRDYSDENAAAGFVITAILSAIPAGIVVGNLFYIGFALWFPELFVVKYLPSEVLP